MSSAAVSDTRVSVGATSASTRYTAAGENSAAAADTTLTAYWGSRPAIMMPAAGMAMAPRRRPSTSRTLFMPSCRGEPRNITPKSLANASSTMPPMRGQGGYAAHGIEHVHAVADAVHHAQVYEELAREAVQGRQGAYGGRGQQEQRRRDGHALGGAAEVVEQRGVHLRVEVARAEVQQRLEERVVERVQQGAAEGYRRHDGVVGPRRRGRLRPGR